MISYIPKKQKVHNFYGKFSIGLRQDLGFFLMEGLEILVECRSVNAQPMYELCH